MLSKINLFKGGKKLIILYKVLNQRSNSKFVLLNHRGLS